MKNFISRIVAVGLAGCLSAPCYLSSEWSALSQRSTYSELRKTWNEQALSPRGEVYGKNAFGAEPTVQTYRRAAAERRIGANERPAAMLIGRKYKRRSKRAEPFTKPPNIPVQYQSLTLLEGLPDQREFEQLLKQAIWAAHQSKGFDPDSLADTLDIIRQTPDLEFDPGPDAAILKTFVLAHRSYSDAILRHIRRINWVSIPLTPQEEEIVRRLQILLPDITIQANAVHRPLTTIPPNPSAVDWRPHEKRLILTPPINRPKSSFTLYSILEEIPDLILGRRFETPQQVEAFFGAFNGGAQSGRLFFSLASTDSDIRQHLVHHVGSFGPSLRILSIGAGRGDVERELIRLGHTVVATDSSGQSVETLQQHGIDAIQIHGLDLPAEFNESFDVVLFSESIGYFNPEQAFDMAHRVLKPGGHLAMTQYPAELMAPFYMLYSRRRLDRALRESHFGISDSAEWPMQKRPEHSLLYLSASKDTLSDKVFDRTEVDRREDVKDWLQVEFPALVRMMETGHWPSQDVEEAWVHFFGSIDHGLQHTLQEWFDSLRKKDRIRERWESFQDGLSREWNLTVDLHLMVAQGKPVDVIAVWGENIPNRQRYFREKTNKTIIPVDVIEPIWGNIDIPGATNMTCPRIWLSRQVADDPVLVRRVLAEELQHIHEIFYPIPSEDWKHPHPLMSIPEVAHEISPWFAILMDPELNPIHLLNEELLPWADLIPLERIQKGIAVRGTLWYFETRAVTVHLLIALLLKSPLLSVISRAPSPSQQLYETLVPLGVAGIRHIIRDVVGGLFGLNRSWGFDGFEEVAASPLSAPALQEGGPVRSAKQQIGEAA